MREAIIAERIVESFGTAVMEMTFLKIKIPSGHIFHQTDFDVVDFEDEVRATCRRYGGKLVSGFIHQGSWEIILQFPDDVDKTRVVSEIRRLPEWKLPLQYGATIDWE
jgi:hypothetical protein